jgi:D-glycero-D-manno-heptose 1,7-bisphosphate phosphatase
MRRAVFLDRDGVINVKAPEGQYITRWEGFQFLPDVADAIARLNRAHFSVIVVSNQRGVAKGLMTVDALEEIHRRMLAELAAASAKIDAIYYCPHDVDASCACRKPSPGLLLQAAEDHGIDLPNSWMVGDSDSDLLVGKNAGCRTVRIVRSGASTDVAPDLAAHSLIEAVQAITQEGVT